MDNKTTIRVNKFALMGCRQSPRDVTTASLRLVKNVVEPQKFDQELRVSYKPTAFRRWVVDKTTTNFYKYFQSCWGKTVGVNKRKGASNDAPFLTC